MYLLDTNHCSRLLQGDNLIRQRILAVDPADVAISVVVRGELLYKAFQSQRVAENLAEINAFLRTVTAYHVDAAVAFAYAQLKAELFRQFGPKERAKQRHTTTAQLGFDENDLWIAATALRFDLIVVSSDWDFARIADAVEFRHESWLTSAGDA